MESVRHSILHNTREKQEIGSCLKVENKEKRGWQVTLLRVAELVVVRVAAAVAGAEEALEVVVAVVKVAAVVEEAPAWDLVGNVYVPVVERQFRISPERLVCMRSAPSVGRL